VWFQHLHKAAGTYVIRRAMANGEQFYENHENGNPCGEGGVIPLWEMNSNELTKFVDQCEDKGVTFVATEWGAPDFSVLAQDSRIHLITCFRDPIKRFISNFNYDYYWMWSDSKSYNQYISENNLHSSPEYYTRMFSRNADLSKSLTQTDFETAKKNITLFDTVIIAETGMSTLEELGWIEESDTKHPTFGNISLALSLLRKLRFFRLFKYLLQKKHIPPLEMNIENINKYDIQLYNTLSIKKF
jgi:hypothetical protein